MYITVNRLLIVYEFIGSKNNNKIKNNIEK